MLTAHWTVTCFMFTFRVAAALRPDSSRQVVDIDDDERSRPARPRLLRGRGRRAGEAASSVRHRSVIGPSSVRHRSVIGPSSVRHRSVIGPSSVRYRSVIGPSSVRHRSVIGPSSVRHRSVIGPSSIAVIGSRHQ